MFLIVFGHIIGGHLPLVISQFSSIETDLHNSILGAIPQLSFFVPFHINLFILISGYCGITKTKHSLIKNYCVLFSSLLTICIIAFLTGQKYDFVKELILPLTHNPWWYMRIYAAACLILPISEKLLSTQPLYILRNLVFGLLTIDIWFSFYCQIDSMHNGGYDLLHFLTIYFIGSYLKRTDLKCILKKRFHLGFKELFLIFCLTMLLKLAYYSLLSHIGIKDWFMDYNQPFNIALSIVAFLAIINIKIKSKLLLFFSTSMVGVYLLHTHPVCETLIRLTLQKMLSIFGGNATAIIGIPLLTIGIILICVLIDKLRVKAFGWLYGTINYISSKLGTVIRNKSLYKRILM